MKKCHKKKRLDPSQCLLLWVIVVGVTKEMEQEGNGFKYLSQGAREYCILLILEALLF